MHKANILKCRTACSSTAGARSRSSFPEIEFDEMIVDACVHEAGDRPDQFDVIVTMNLFGDIISDLCAGLVGGLGLAPAANIGATRRIFEAVHGTAPDIAGKGIANPTALMLSAAMLLDHIGERTAADRLVTAVREAIASKEAITPDLGGSASTKMFTWPSSSGFR